MASQAAYQAEKVIGHGDNAVTQQDVTSYEGETGKSGETMKALAWMGKNKVKMGTTHNTLTYTHANYLSRCTQTQDS